MAGRDRRDLCGANCIGQEIWPDAKMTSQGFGGAASRILNRLKKDGYVEWMSTDRNWGWRITQAGRGYLETL